jgi:PAS domain S-box-containing protein
MSAQTGRDGHREEIEHLYLALRSIREVDRLLIKIGDRPALLQAICDTLIKDRSYYNAWMVILDDSNRVSHTAEAGLGDDFRPMLERLRRGLFTECGRRALAGSGVVVVDSPYDSCTDCPLSGKYSGRSAMTVRLEHAGKTYGLLCVSIPRPFTENEEELRLLQEIAGDIAFGLNKMALEEALAANRRRFMTLVENSPTGIMIVQKDRVVYRNPEQQSLTGLGGEADAALELENVHPDDLDRVKEWYAKIVSGGADALDLDFRFYPAGTMKSRADMKWVYCRASSIKYGGEDAVLVNMLDISRAKELEQLLAVKDKMASLGHIAAGIAHEVRNPLSGINIYLNTLEGMLEDRGDPVKMRQILDQAQSASSKIESIIKGVVDFSRPSEPKFELADVNEPIREALQLSSAAMRRSGVRLRRSLAEGLPPCRIDRTLIEEVMLNLITNAAEAMSGASGDKTIEVTSAAHGTGVQVRVSDSGPGIPAGLRDKVLEPFYTTKKSGTGIGLSICHRIVTDHGGSMSIESSKWSGAEFVIELPAEREP